MRRGSTFWLGVAVIFAIGVGIIAGSGIWLREPYRHVFGEIGLAIIVASILGATIDLFLKSALTKDAVEAALGYVLPSPLRGEMRWIYDQKILCTRHHTRFRISAIDSQLVVVGVRYDRTLRNVCGDTQSIDLPLAIDEWGHSRASSIKKFGYHIEGGAPVELAERELMIDRSVPHVLSMTPIEVKVGRDQHVTVWAEYEEVCRTNDQHMIVFRVPTQDPHVEVLIDDGYDVTVSFGHREKFSTLKLGNHAWQLDGLLLPNQHIRIVWWPISQAVRTESPLAVRPA